jgi:hypothetical protein
MYDGVPTTTPIAREPLLIGDLRHPEIQDLDLNALVGTPHQEHVRGLEIAVHDADGVRRRKPPADLSANGDRNADRQLLHSIAKTAEILSLEELRHQAGQPVTRAHDIDHLDDMFARNARRSLRLPLEPSHGLGVATQRLVHDFHGEAARQPHVLGLVHAPHAARTE